MVQDWTSNIKVARGKPLPYGVSEYGAGANFSVYAREAHHMSLVIYAPSSGASAVRMLNARDPQSKRGSTPDLTRASGSPASASFGEISSVAGKNVDGMSSPVSNSTSSSYAKLPDEKDVDGKDESALTAEASPPVQVAPTHQKRVELKLDPRLNRTGQVWHVHIYPYLENFEYMWKVGLDENINPKWGTNLALDPYAMVVRSPMGPKRFNNHPDQGVFRPRAVIPRRRFLDFDWKNVARPRIPMSELVIYEMHVRGFTMSPSSGVRAGGTYLGIVEKIPYLRELGVNCVELLPVMEFNETEWNAKNLVGKKLSQYWGYSTVNFFSPMNRYALEAGELTAADEFRLMVRQLHAAGIEVLLDVVFNHTAEMGDSGMPPGYYGMKALANDTYYIRSPEGKYMDFTGCGNTVNVNNPIVAEWFHKAILYWFHEMGVDGFRFDLAAAMCRDPQGQPMKNPPAIERITKDPSLRDAKFIAEAWDCAGLYLVGNFPHYGTWSEWNGVFRDSCRSFIRGAAGAKRDFASRLCGSADLYNNGRKPYNSINFVVAHDGFSLHDLVSYNDKHNEENGENNRDGEGHNNSWNCGVEGSTNDMNIRQLRIRQIKNFAVALFLSAGTPMMLMGDEYGHSKNGNNNAWCQDSDLNYFQWRKLKEDPQAQDLFRFFKSLIRFRRRTKVLMRETFIGPSDIVWHGAKPQQPNWESDYNFLACTLIDHSHHEDVYVAFNAGSNAYDVVLPDRGGSGTWYRVIDTSLQSPKDVCEVKSVPVSGNYRMGPYSSLVLKSSPQGGEIVAGANFMRTMSIAQRLGNLSQLGPDEAAKQPQMRREPSTSSFVRSTSALFNYLTSSEPTDRPAVLKESPSVLNLAFSDESNPPLLQRSISRWDLGH